MVVSDMRLLTADENNEIWSRVIGELGFNSRGLRDGVAWLDIPIPHKVYVLPARCWDEKREKIVNEIFKGLTDGDIYALDWQHDCFLFSPHEDITYFYNYYDAERDVQVYFPEYYPNGDYHFFMDVNRRFGMFGNPLNQQMIVFGEELIAELDKHCAELFV